MALYVIGSCWEVPEAMLGCWRGEEGQGFVEETGFELMLLARRGQRLLCMVVQRESGRPWVKMWELERWEKPAGKLRGKSQREHVCHPSPG